MGKSSERVSRRNDLAIDPDDIDLATTVGIRSPRGPRPQYVDLDVLKNADDLMAIISQRQSNGVITFAIFKEFDRDGRRERTTFVAESLAESYKDLLDITITRIKKIKADPQLMKELYEKAGAEMPKFHGAERRTERRR
jgi:hypothetical protein